MDTTNSKRPRAVYQTPVHAGSSVLSAQLGMQTTPAGGAVRTGDILDYLKGRGGRIRELEDAVAEQRATNERLTAELATAHRELAELQQGGQRAGTSAAAPSHRSSTLRSEADQDGGSPATQEARALYIQELERLLSDELAKTVKLEEKLAAAQERAAAAEVAAAAAREAAAAQQVAADAAARKASVESESLRRELASVRAQAQEQVDSAQRLAASQSEAAAAATKLNEATTAALAHTREQLVAKTQEVAALTQQLAKARATAAARGSTPPPAAITSPSTPPAAPDPHSMQVIAELRAQVGMLQATLTAQQDELTVLRANAAVTAPATPGAGHAEAGSTHHTAVTGGGSPTAPEMAEQLAAAQAEVTELRALCAAHDAAQLERNALLQQATAREAAVVNDLATSRARADGLAAELQVTQARMTVLTQERDSLRAALTAPVPGAATSAPDSISARLAAAQAASRAAQAESQVLSLQHELDKTQAELLAVSQREATARGTAETATARATTAEARVLRLEAEADGLARDVAALQEKLGRGEFSRSSNMRVLHLRMNPESEYQKQAAAGKVGELEAQVAALQSSLSDTQAALAAMEARAVAAEARTQGSHPALSPAAGTSGVRGAGAGGSTAELLARLAARDAEVAVLRHQASEAGKASTRLREVFKERAAAFREAVYCLFGYRVNMASEATPASAAGSAPTTFTLTPQHADSPEDVLVFRYTKDGGMQLVPTPFTRGRLAREVDTFVTRFHCIPALTANLTMESFQKQTQC